MKIRSVGAQLFHAGGWAYEQTDSHTDIQTDMTEIIIAFRNFANALKS